MTVTEAPPVVEAAPPLAAAVSEAAVALIDRLQASVVQVHRAERGGGAGIIWRTDGAIVTNYHVVAGGGDVRVQLTDGRDLPARVVNENPALDLALLQVDATDLPAAPVGDSTRLRVGELVFAIGHPWGQPGVVTVGIISGTGTVTPPGSTRSAQFVRSDVRLAPGNSGGPLVNAWGTVVGINAMILGGDLSVAIPSHVAATWVAGQPSRPVRLGMQIVPVELGPAEQRGLLSGRAAALLVGAVDPTGPAGLAALLPGDLLLAVDGQPVADAESLRAHLDGAGDRPSIRLDVLRGGAPLGLDVILAGADTPA